MTLRMETMYQPKALTPEQLQTLCRELKQALTDLYGDRLDRLVLFGSYARGDYHAESDVDFLVVLRDEQVKSGQEVISMAPIAGSLALDYGVEVSIFPTTVQTNPSARTPFYQIVYQEGTCV